MVYVKLKEKKEREPEPGRDPAGRPDAAPRGPRDRRLRRGGRADDGGEAAHGEHPRRGHLPPEEVRRAAEGGDVPDPRDRRPGGHAGARHPGIPPHRGPGEGDGPRGEHGDGLAHGGGPGGGPGGDDLRGRRTATRSTCASAFREPSGVEPSQVALLRVAVPSGAGRGRAGAPFRSAQVPVERDAVRDRPAGPHPEGGRLRQPRRPAARRGDEEGPGGVLPAGHGAGVQAWSSPARGTR